MPRSGLRGHLAVYRIIDELRVIAIFKSRDDIARPRYSGGDNRQLGAEAARLALSVKDDDARAPAVVNRDGLAGRDRHGLREIIGAVPQNVEIRIQKRQAVLGVAQKLPVDQPVIGNVVRDIPR